jgi:hypothetical protein
MVPAGTSYRYTIGKLEYFLKRIFWIFEDTHEVQTGDNVAVNMRSHNHGLRMRRCGSGEGNLNEQQTEQELGPG